MRQTARQNQERIHGESPKSLSYKSGRWDLNGRRIATRAFHKNLPKSVRSAFGRRKRRSNSRLGSRTDTVRCVSDRYRYRPSAPIGARGTWGPFRPSPRKLHLVDCGGFLRVRVGSGSKYAPAPAECHQLDSAPSMGGCRGPVTSEQDEGRAEGERVCSAPRPDRCDRKSAGRAR